MLSMAVSQQSETTMLEELRDLEGTAGARVDDQPRVEDFKSALETQKGRARLPDD